jgi:hypothetical protein
MDNFLVGKTILGIDSDKEYIIFKTDVGDIKYEAYGDCCSYTWIEHLECPDLGSGAEVLGIEDLNLGSEEQHEYDVVQFYQSLVKTNKGTISIEYRNSSNGYYGGELQRVNERGEHQYN